MVGEFTFRSEPESIYDGARIISPTGGHNRPLARLISVSFNNYLDLIHLPFVGVLGLELPKPSDA